MEYMTRQEAHWEKYLRDKAVDKLLRGMTDALISHEPENPTSFLLDFLRSADVDDAAAQAGGEAGSAASSRRYGWRREVFDAGLRTVDVGAVRAARGGPPDVYDMRERSGLPAVFDQKSLGASAVFTVLSAALHDAQKRKGAQQVGPLPLNPSFLFLYYAVRDADRTTEADAGASVGAVVEAARKFGVPSARSWPFVPAKFRARPSPEAYKDALQARLAGLRHRRVATRDPAALMRLVASNTVVCAGFSVYESFEGPGVAANGVLPMPAKGERLLGGHTAVVVGYAKDRHVIMLNSWSSSWGDRGFFYMPWPYFFSDNLADLWVVDLGGAEEAEAASRSEEDATRSVVTEEASVMESLTRELSGEEDGSAGLDDDDDEEEEEEEEEDEEEGGTSGTVTSMPTTIS